MINGFVEKVTPVVTTHRAALSGRSSTKETGHWEASEHCKLGELKGHG